MTPTEVIDDWLVNDPPENGGTSPSEDVLNDSLIVQPALSFDNDYSEYISALSNLNFENPREIEEFSRRFNEPNDQFFFGYKDYRDFVFRSLGA